MINVLLVDNSHDFTCTNYCVTTLGAPVWACDSYKWSSNRPGDKGNDSSTEFVRYRPTFHSCTLTFRTTSLSNRIRNKSPMNSKDSTLNNISSQVDLTNSNFPTIHFLFDILLIIPCSPKYFFKSFDLKLSP